MATDTAIWPLQTAVFKRLSNDAELSGLITGVYDAVLEDLAYPYLTIGPPVTIGIETKGSYVEEISLTIDAWSIYAGKKEAAEILSAVHKAIGKGLSIEGPFTLLKVKRPDIQVIDDIDPRIKHGIARFTITIKNN